VCPREALTPRNVELGDDPLWYKDAIVYEVHVRAFFDSTNDGNGDFPGLTDKLDYLQELGITCLWLLPFYPSPLRDDGYDISQYERVHPVYGTMRDFRTFMREAHHRGIRVITELVVNHTSDEHPWFQAARRAPAGSSKRDFYVWSDTKARYRDAPVFFDHSKSSNWTWDDEAQAYYWHRFFSHQPDLNFDNPKVLRAVLRVMRFLLDAGVDGLRLDAVPYLVEREGTICENLPETHAILRAIRRELDARYASRVLLAEANLWPADVQAYLGDGDECHMAFHFPLMPRIFMAIRKEDNTPILDLMRQTPPVPDSCQWALLAAGLVGGYTAGLTLFSSWEEHPKSWQAYELKEFYPIRWDRLKERCSFLIQWHLFVVRFYGDAEGVYNDCEQLPKVGALNVLDR